MTNHRKKLEKVIGSFLEDFEIVGRGLHSEDCRTCQQVSPKDQLLDQLEEYIDQIVGEAVFGETKRIANVIHGMTIGSNTKLIFFDALNDDAIKRNLAKLTKSK